MIFSFQATAGDYSQGTQGNTLKYLNYVKLNILFNWCKNIAVVGTF